MSIVVILITLILMADPDNPNIPPLADKDNNIKIDLDTPSLESENSGDSKNQFKHKLLKLSAFWKALPKKYRFSLCLTTGTVVITFLLLVVSAKFGKITSVDIGRESRFVPGIENWTRLLIPERQPAFFSLISESASKYGILPKGTFLLTTKKPVDENFIKEHLESSVPVNIMARTATQYAILPQKSLNLDQTVNIKLAVKDLEAGDVVLDRNYSWAFQTQGKFRIVSSIPGNRNTNVPVNTGIEIVFSQDDYQDPAKYLSIEPAIEYRLERHGETLTIVPQKELQEKTVYTVNLHKGLSLQSRNDPIAEDYVFTFQTYDKQVESASLYVYENFLQTSTKETLITRILANAWENEDKITVKLYQFSSGTDFVNSRNEIDDIESGWSNYYADKAEVSTNNLALASEFEVTLNNKEDITYLQFPQPLPKGYYLAQLWYGENKKKFEQFWLQSTDLTGYITVGKKETSVWINTVEEGPVSSAEVKVLANGSTYSTNDAGTALFSTPQSFFDRKKQYLSIKKNDSSLILPVSGLNSFDRPDEETTNDYWAYLYHERILYKVTDNIHFWGVVKNRNTNQAPSSVEVILTQYPYADNKDNTTIKTSVVPQPDGSYIGNLAFTNTERGWYRLQTRVNKLTVSDESVQILDYEKPEMKIEVDTDKKAIYTSEQVVFTAKVSFYDGTPVKNVPLNINTSRGNIHETQNTNNEGEVTYTYHPSYDDDRYYPRY